MNTADNIEIVGFDGNLLKEAAEIEKESFSDPWTENMLYETSLNNDCDFLCAVSDGVLTGYVILGHCLDEGEILNIAVKPSERKNGIGRKLMNAAINRRKLTDIFLEVRESNLPARNLYLSLGFEVIALRKNYYKKPTENAIIMKLTKGRQDS